MLDPTFEAEGLGPSAFSEALKADWGARRDELAERIGGAKLLVVGAAGTIGSATVRQLLEFAPARMEMIDLDENGLARLARDIRSRGAGPGTALGFNALDFAAPPGLAFAAAEGPFDLVLNFAAVKHVRSEKNPFTLLHMLGVNVVSQRRFAEHLRRRGLATRYFVVSTDKAADPASFMGATKHLLEQLVFAEADHPGAPVTSAARFANVAYSSGSLLESYLQRFDAGQALAAPRDTRRYFISARDAARICLIAQLVCANRRLAVPRFDPASGAVELADTAARFLRSRGRTAAFVDTPEAAAQVLAGGGAGYPVLLTPRDTAGEKEIEVFRGRGEIAESLGLGALEALRPAPVDTLALNRTLSLVADWVSGARPTPDLAEVADAIAAVAPSFTHLAAKTTLDDRIFSPLNIAIAVFRLAPAGGLEQHALRIAAELIGRGHAVTLVTTRPPAEAPAAAKLMILKRRGHTNHGRIAAFAKDALGAVAGRFDRTVSCLAIPGFDVNFCADPSRSRLGALRGLMPRYRTYAALERRAFGPEGRSRILCLSSVQRDAFARNDATPAERLFLLPPTVDRLRADAAAAEHWFRADARGRFAPEAKGQVWIWMGLQPHTKGLDRALAALADVPSARLLVSALDRSSPAARPMRALARRLGVADHLTWLGFLPEADVPAALAAADLLVHPSRADVTGNVILEALVNGVPVITTAVCGYGEHVTRAGAGLVLGEPFRQSDLAAALAQATPERRALWSAGALAYTRSGDLFGGIARAADLIEMEKLRP